MRWFNLNAAIIILVIIIILFAVGIGIVGFSLWDVTKARELFPFLAISEEFPNKAIALFTSLLAWTTLFLALATILTIKNSNEHEKRHREEEQAREMRDRKEFLLNEIREWAEDVAKYSLKTGIFDETVPISESAAEGALPELLNSVVDFRMARAVSVYVMNISSEINPELKLRVDNLTEEIKKQIKYLMEYKRKLTPTYPVKQVVAEISGNNERIYNLSTKLIEEAAKIKTENIS